MNAHSLKTILVDELDGTADGDAIALPAAAKVSVLLRFGDDLLRVANLERARFTEEFVHLVGEKEQLFVDVDCDFVVKSEDSKKRLEARPGFHSA